MVAVLGGLADVERDLIRTRAAEGRSRAKAQGKHISRPLPSHRHKRKRPSGGAQGATLEELARSYHGGKEHDCPVDRILKGLSSAGTGRVRQSGVVGS